MAGNINGFTLAYTAAGGVILWSGIKGVTISTMFQDLLKGQAPTAAQNTEQIGSPELNIGSASSSPAAGVTGTLGDSPAGSDNQNINTAAQQLYGLYGYSRAAAAGIAGCIAGESSGNPEAVGDEGTSFGLIQEHGSQYSGLVTGNSTADFNRQVAALVSYNEAQGGNLIAMLNAQTNPVLAADFYSEYFERPLVTDSDVRAGVAESVYALLGTGTSAQETG